MHNGFACKKKNLLQEFCWAHRTRRCLVVQGRLHFDTRASVCENRDGSAKAPGDVSAGHISICSTTAKRAGRKRLQSCI